MSEKEILVTRAGHLGAIRLNRPKALNSLTLGMVRAFAVALEQFAADHDIHAVLVNGAGERGLCAGGDIRALYDAREGKVDYKRFWREEYELNARIASFPKVYVVIMDGVVMGGGVGVSAHGNRRIVTERTRLAMPETGIGFIPDVGGTWLLTRKGGAGIYMALSGVAVAAADAIHIGLADIAIDSASISELECRLASTQDARGVDAVLSDFARMLAKGVLEENRPLLDRAMLKDSVEDVIDALAADDSSFGRDAARDIGQKSPTSLKVTFELLKRAREAENLEACLTNEFRAACRLLESHDLYEGIRAAIIDKDRQPRWSPATLEAVDDAKVTAILRGSGDPDPIFRAWETTCGLRPDSAPRSG
jgi:enoyl-CoA hydratase